MWSCLHIQVRVLVTEPKRAQAWKSLLATPKKQQSPQSSLGSSAFSRRIPKALPGPWPAGLCCRDQRQYCVGKDVPPVQGCCWQSRAANPGTAGEETLRWFGHHIWKLLLTSSAVPETSPERLQLGKGRWEPQWLSPCSRAWDSANVSLGQIFVERSGPNKCFWHKYG